MALNEFGDEIIEDVSLQLNEFGDPIVAAQRTLRPSTQQALAEREAFGQQLQRQAQASPIERGISGATDIGSMIGDLIMSNVRGVGALPEMLSQPQTIIPTALEGTRRAATDLGSFINSIVPVGKIVDSRGPRELIENTLGAVSSPFVTPGSLGKVAGSNSLQELITNLMGTSPAVSAIQSLAPKTLTPEEIQRAFEESKAQQGIQDVRTQVDPRFSSAQPEVSEALGKDLPFLLPVGVIRGAKGASLEADIGRSVRAAVKPPNAQIGARIQKAADDEMADIFNINRNADKAAIPLEGFAQSVSSLRKSVGEQIGVLRAKVGTQSAAGDDIAAALEKRAASLERAGEPSGSVQFLRDRATDFKGKLTEIDDLQEAVTLANQRRSPFFSRARAAQDPMRANVEGIADNIIAEQGGTSINKALESVGGAEGSALRKKWSNLTAIEKQTLERVNKLINQAPAEVQGAFANAINSIQGMGGLLGVLQGYASASIPLGNAVLRGFQKLAQKELKDSNALIQKTYDRLRKNPPTSTPVQTAQVNAVETQPTSTQP